MLKFHCVAHGQLRLAITRVRGGNYTLQYMEAHLHARSIMQFVDVCE